VTTVVGVSLVLTVVGLFMDRRSGLKEGNGPGARSTSEVVPIEAAE